MGLQRHLPLFLNYMGKLDTYFVQTASLGTLNLSANHVPKLGELSPIRKISFRHVYSDEQP